MTLHTFTTLILKELGIVETDSTPSHNFLDVTRCLNESFQNLWTKVPRELRERYTKSRITVDFFAGQTRYALPDGIQTITGEIKSADDPRYILSQVKTLWEAENFENLYSCRNCSENDDPRPKAFFYDRTATGFTAANEASKNELVIAPAPSRSEPWILDVELECPSFRPSDLCDDNNSVPIPIPDQYIESILYPIARYKIAQALYFSNQRKDMIPIFKDEHDEALRLAGATAI